MKKQTKAEYFNNLIAVIESRVLVEEDAVGVDENLVNAWQHNQFYNDCTLEDFKTAIRIIRDRQNAFEIE